MSNRRYLYDGDRLVRLGMTAQAIDDLRDSPLGREVLPSVLHAAWRILQAKLGLFRMPTHDVSVGDFLTQLFGRAHMVDNFASAMIHGIYGGDIYKLSAQMLFPGQMYRFYHSSIFAGDSVQIAAEDFELAREMVSLRSVAEGSRGVPKKGLFAPRGGMSSLVAALEKELGKRTNVSIKTGTPVRGLQYRRGRDIIEVIAHPFENRKASLLGGMTDMSCV
jgi:oxygen-dependent protoporphyrinogen oxidase